MATSSRWKAVARNLWLTTTAFVVALFAFWLGHRRLLYSQECSWILEKNQQEVVVLTREDFPLLFFAQPTAGEQQGAVVPMIRVPTCHVFSQDYFQARTIFRKLVQDLIYVQEQKQQQQAESYNKNDDDGAIMKKQQQTIKLYTLPIVPEMDYTIDIVVLPGSDSISNGTGTGLVLHTSGVHGVEGYAGSAIQLAFLKALLLHAQLQEERRHNATSSTKSPSSFFRPTIVLIHAVNPFGMARFRRANENNVDLNRNGISQYDWNHRQRQQGRLEANVHANHENYARFDTTLFNMLDQPEPPNGIWFLYKAIKAVLQHGIPRIKAAMVAGQYYQPRGVFYGGKIGTLEPSIRILQEWLQNVLLPTQRPLQGDGYVITWIDVHTGLGKFGHDTLLFKNNVESSRSSEMMVQQQMAQWFPGSVSNTLSQPSSRTKETTPTDDDYYDNAKDVNKGYEQALGFLAEYLAETVFDPNSRLEEGNHHDYGDKESKEKNSSTLVVTQEFGTLHNILVGHALMTENSAFDYYYRQRNQPDVAREYAKSTLGRAFYPQNRQWRRQVLMRGLRVLHQAIQRSSQGQVQ